MKKYIRIIAAIFVPAVFFTACSPKKPVESAVGQNSETQISENENYEESEIKEKTENENFFPATKNFYMTTDNLKIRSAEGLDSQVLYVLPKDTRVFVIELGRGEEIDGVKACWAKVVIESCIDLSGKKIENGATGWCFGSYLYKKKALTAEEIPAVLKECPHYISEKYDDYEYTFYFEENNELFIEYGYAEDVSFAWYKYTVEDGYITIKKDADNNGENDRIFFNFEDESTLDLEYDIDNDVYMIDCGRYSSKKREYSILYDKENDMLFVRCGRFAEGSTKTILAGEYIYSAEESYLYSHPDTASEKLTYKEYLLLEIPPEGYKIYNLDRFFTGQRIHVNAKSLYPVSKNKYWYSTEIGMLNPRTAYFLCSTGEAPSFDDSSDYHKEFEKKQIQRVEELAKQGVLKIKPLTEEEKQSILYAKWLPDLYARLFNDSE